MKPRASHPAAGPKPLAAAKRCQPRPPRTARAQRAVSYLLLPERRVVLFIVLPNLAARGCISNVPKAKVKKKKRLAGSFLLTFLNIFI
jgi:hypothetical protein